MDDFNSNTSQNESYHNVTAYFNYSNITNVYDDDSKVEFIKHVATCIIITIGLPLILVAIYSLYSLVRKDNVAPIYVINLLISDLLQLCCMILIEALCYPKKTCEYVRVYAYAIFFYILLYGVVVSVGFMVCIALERYLLIAFPLWYRFRRTIKSSVVVCVLVWVVTLVPLITFLLSWVGSSIVAYTLVAVCLLLPLPLFIFFLCGTLKALSASISVSSDEKRRIVGILVLVLLIYTLLFLPFIILLLSVHKKSSDMYNSIYHPAFMILKLSPLADLVLYIFMRKGAIDKLLACLCRCTMNSNDNNRPKDLNNDNM